MNEHQWFLVAIAIVAVAAAFAFLANNWTGTGSTDSAQGFSADEQEKLSQARLAFEQSDNQEIDGFVEIAQTLSVEKIIEVCRQDYFTDNQAVCLRTMALGKETPEETAAVCGQINPDFCDSLYPTGEENAACRENAAQHKEECPLKIPFWR